jgi:hypothetical protein
MDRGMSLRQWLVTLAKPTMQKKRIATPARIASGESLRVGLLERGIPIAAYNAPSLGHTATHSRHPVHSAERIWTSLSTGK